jgi:hypothetical protein
VHESAHGTNETHGSFAADICSLRGSGQQCCGTVMRAIDPEQT